MKATTLRGLRLFAGLIGGFLACLLLAACSRPPVGPSGRVEFASCEEPTGVDLNAAILQARLDSVRGFYLSAEEIAAISCVWAPQAVLAGYDELLANEWASAIGGEAVSGLEIGRYRSIAVNITGEGRAEAMAVDATSPESVIGMELALDEGSWLITSWDYEASCSDILSFRAALEASGSDLLETCDG